MKYRLFIGICLGLLTLAACGNTEKKEISFQGGTMGTIYSVKVVAAEEPEGLQAKIEQRLAEINQSMSTYRKDSEISRFNDFDRVGTPFPVSDDFFNVMTVAADIFRLSGGAWDGTVDPLVTLWGFGRKGVVTQVPDPAAIQAVMPKVGFQHIRIDSAKKALVKAIPDVTLDLASIAKGYGVDQLARLLKQEGFEDFLVDIGGEIYAAGVRLDGQNWRIGINTPRPDAAFDAVYKVATLHNRAFATSGDYRKYFEADGKRYSHVIDPRTGMAVANRVVSVSVMADTCTFADGLATALMVMGPETAIPLVDSLPGVECLMVTTAPDGTLSDHFSAGFPNAG